MTNTRFLRSTCIAACFGFAGGPALAADLFADNVADVLRTETIAVEGFTGYLTGSSKEYVFNGPGGSRLSQLNWDLGDALAAGGRVSLRPLDWLTLRGTGWVTVEADSRMHDFDWLYGYGGQNTWSHESFSPNTMTPKAWKADGSISAAYWQDDELALTVVGGYRHYGVKFEARGGTYIYSVNGFRDSTGTLPNDGVGLSYRQSWDAAYLGLGASYAGPVWGVSAEIIGGPTVSAHAEDNHVLRSLYFRDKLDTSAMLGASGSIEYRFASNLSLIGRAEYQKFFQAKGSETARDYLNNVNYSYPRGSIGAEAETFFLSLGLKARI